MQDLSTKERLELLLEVHRLRQQNAWGYPPKPNRHPEPKRNTAPELLGKVWSAWAETQIAARIAVAKGEDPC